MSEEAIQKLVTEALEILGAENIHNMAMQHVDMKALSEIENISQKDYEATLTAAGFLAGVRFTLENIEAVEEQQQD